MSKTPEERAANFERKKIVDWLEECANNCFVVRDSELDDGDYVGAALSDNHAMALVGIAIEIKAKAHHATAKGG